MSAPQMASRNSVRVVSLLRAARGAHLAQPTLSSTAATTAGWSSAFSRSFTGQGRLGGGNIFQLAAAATDKVATTDEAAAAEPMELPTSDESEKLLRVRHSVSYRRCCCWQHAMQTPPHISPHHMAVATRSHGNLATGERRTAILCRCAPHSNVCIQFMRTF